MKTTVTSIAAAIIMMTTFSAFAANTHNPVKSMDSKSIVLSYVEATTLGNDQLQKELFAKNFSFENLSNGDKYNAATYRSFLKANKGLKYDCTTSYELLTETADECTAKATMKFANFTRVDLITLSKSQEGWKLSKVLTTYP